MQKRYKITIEEIGQEEKKIGCEWEMGAGEAPTEYGYTPEITATRDYSREVYQQTVNDLDLSAVVAVINGIQR